MCQFGSISSIDREFKYLNLTQILYRYNKYNVRYVYNIYILFIYTITTVNYKIKNKKKIK